MELVLGNSDRQKLEETVRKGSDRQQARAAVLIFLADNPGARIEDAAIEIGESFGFAAYALRLWQQKGLEPFRVVAPRREQGQPERPIAIRWRRAPQGAMCKACQHAPASYALRGKCARCKWRRKQLEFACSHCPRIGWILAGQMMQHLTGPNVHAMNSQTAWRLINAAKEEDAEQHSD